MNKGFEHKISELMEPLAEHRVILHYPMFANTFPLAYYYAKYLKVADPGIKVDDLVMQKDWNVKTLPVVSDEAPFHLIFDTEWREEKKSKYGRPIQFTKYLPRFIFTDINSELISFLSTKKLFMPYVDKRTDFYRKEIDDNAPIFDLNLPIFRELISFLEVDKIRIYTDIVDEAELIKKLINHRENLPLLEVDIIEAESDWAHKVDDDQQPLTFYFFSAPVNTLFLKQHCRYLPLKIQSWAFSTIETYNYLVHQKQAAKRKLKAIQSALEEFHKLIFYQASHCPENLMEVAAAYNRVIRINDPLKVFENVYVYAKCIHLYAPKIEQNTEPSEMTLIWEKLTNPGRRENYFFKLEEIYTASVDKCNILVWYHLIKHSKVSMHSRLIEYGAIRKIMFNDDLGEGYYAILLRDYITLKLDALIQEMKQDPDHCINRALNIGITEEAIRQALTMRTEKMIFKENGDFHLDKLFDVVDERFDVLRELKTMETSCESNTGLQKIKYIKRSIGLIRIFYMELLDRIADSDERANIVFIGDALTRIPLFEDVLKSRKDGGMQA